MKENTSTEEYDIVDFDIWDCLAQVWKRKWIVVLVMLIFGAGASVGTKLFIKPVYSSSTRIYITASEKTNASDKIMLYQPYDAKQYMDDFVEMGKGRKVLKSAARETGLSSEEIASKIDVSVIENTRFLEIVTKDTNPKTAQSITKAVGDATVREINQSTDEIFDANIEEEANLPTAPESSGSVRNNGLKGAALGLILSVGIIIIVFIFRGKKGISSNHHAEK
ncbi:MAG: Wzz/FepE/Etk N-terminal domain-containing protein [Eubacteriales bacterium]|nr:Wzz/FepE/Etk N-terminal domain-containing protein [Eubacteriales bacterium]